MKRNFLLLISAATFLISSGCAGGGAVKPLGRGATHFSITAQASSTVGAAFNFTVTALDASNNVASKYTGTVQVTSSDIQAVLLPPNSTLVNGSSIFSATMNTAGSQTITATDTVAASITGTSASIDVSASLGPPHFSLTTPANDTAGTSFNFTVNALDGANNLLPSYSGTVSFTSSDSQASLPANSTLTNGTGSFSATMKTAGSQVVIAADTVTASMTGTSSAINVSPAGTTHFSVVAPAYVNSGTAFQLDVTALDAWNNIASAYSGMAHFSSSDGAAVLPADSGFAAGTGRFSATLNTLGVQAVRATDTVGSITGTLSLTVIPAGTLVITSGQPPNGTVGTFYGRVESVCDTPPTTIEGFELEAAGGIIGRRSLTWVGSLMPPGLQLTSVTLTSSPQCYGTIWFIDGTPTTAGTFTFSVTARSNSGATGTASYTITIASPQASAVNQQEKALLPGGWPSSIQEQGKSGR